jgi:hypothetical protein
LQYFRVSSQINANFQQNKGSMHKTALVVTALQASWAGLFAFFLHIPKPVFAVKSSRAA